MKKSKFANINFESVEVLSREQMSKVKGGYGESGGGGVCLELYCYGEKPNGGGYGQIGGPFCTAQQALTCCNNHSSCIGCF